MNRWGVCVVGLALLLGAPAHGHDPGGGKDDHLAPPGIGGSGPFASHRIQLLSRLPINTIGGGPGILLSDLWGWTDRLTGREYAVVGRMDGTSFVDVTNPTQPVYLGNLPSHTGSSSWREMRVYNNHAFIISDSNGNHGMQIFDLTNLRTTTGAPRTFTETAHYGGFANAHNIAINEASGHAYVVGSNTASGGLHILDLNNPTAPRLVGQFSADGYTHDLQVVNYVGRDRTYFGREIAFNANEDTFTIVDVTNKAQPTLVARAGYPQNGYAHQGWLTEDQRYFLMNDELDESRLGTPTRTHIWDLGDLDRPIYLGFHEHATRVIDHNLFIRGNLVYESNYTAGLRVLQLTDLPNHRLTEVAFIDTYPTDDAVSFNGAWGNYPFFDSGSILISDRQNGLFVVRLVSAPEPSSLALGVVAGLALLAYGWRRRRQAG
jgi:choice-of-anchor B domain-containing protein